MRILVAAATGTVLVCACTPAREMVDGSPVYRLSEVNVPPVLMGCGRYADPVPFPAREGDLLRVSVTFVIEPDGTVAPWSPRVTGSRDSSVGETAMDMARSCAFTSAQRRGSAVSVRVQRSFWVDRPAPVRETPPGS